MRKELTDIQIKRQDFVDNSIFQLLADVNPSIQTLDWDIEVIGQIRDIINNYFVSKGICTEQDFYPFL